MLLGPFDLKGYKHKNKLGKLMHGSLFPGTDREDIYIVRYIDMARISAYVIEKF
jgi:hypothetical protein